MSSLSSILSYAKKIGWLSGRNPCSSLHKLKEADARDRVITQDEIIRLFKASNNSNNPYLNCIILILFIVYHFLLLIYKMSIYIREEFFSNSYWILLLSSIVEIAGVLGHKTL